MASSADQLVSLVRRAPMVRDQEVAVVLHGEGLSAWPALRYSLDLGLSTRIGLEDVLVMPDGSPAPDNAALVRAAERMRPLNASAFTSSECPRPTTSTVAEPRNSDSVEVAPRAARLGLRALLG